jgi:hypothetical protein
LPGRSGRDEDDTCQSQAGKCRDGPGREARPEPKLEHGHVIAHAALEYSEGAAVSGEERDTFGGQDADRGGQRAIAAASNGTEPHMAETTEFAETDRGVQRA